MSKSVTYALVMSKETFQNLHEVPKLQYIRAERISDSQNANTLFSDSVHSLWVSGGELAKPELTNWMKNSTVRLTTSNNKMLESWIRGIVLEEPKVSFESATNSTHGVSFDSTRSLIESSLEADLKFHRGIQEYYLGNTNFQISFHFNGASKRKTRAKERVLRMKALPVRLVRQLIK